MREPQQPSRASKEVLPQPVVGAERPGDVRGAALAHESQRRAEEGAAGGG